MRRVRGLDKGGKGDHEQGRPALPRPPDCGKGRRVCRQGSRDLQDAGGRPDCFLLALRRLGGPQVPPP